MSAPQKVVEILRPHETFTLATHTEHFDPNTDFVTYRDEDGYGLYVHMDELAKELFALAKPIDGVPEVAMQSLDIVKEGGASDSGIRAELPEPYDVSHDVSFVLLVIKLLILAQWGGKPGKLLNNGDANIFYVRGFAVLVSWNAGHPYWYVDVWRLDDYRWVAGPRVFSRN